jgi:hypothetical protein
MTIYIKAIDFKELSVVTEKNQTLCFSGENFPKRDYEEAFLKMLGRSFQYLHHFWNKEKDRELHSGWSKIIATAFPNFDVKKLSQDGEYILDDRTSIRIYHWRQEYMPQDRYGTSFWITRQS